MCGCVHASMHMGIHTHKQLTHCWWLHYQSHWCSPLSSILSLSPQSLGTAHSGLCTWLHWGPVLRASYFLNQAPWDAQLRNCWWLSISYTMFQHPSLFMTNSWVSLVPAELEFPVNCYFYLPPWGFLVHSDGSVLLRIPQLPITFNVTWRCATFSVPLSDESVWWKQLPGWVLKGTGCVWMCVLFI